MIFLLFYISCYFLVSTEPSTSSHHPEKRKADDSKSTLKKKPTYNVEPTRTKTAKTVQSLGPSGKKSSTDGSLEATTKKTVTEAETRTTIRDDENFSKDRFSSLRIINPLISSVVMEKRMEGRRMVMISQIPTKIKGNNDIDGDWVTIGVIVQKLPPKTSSNVRSILLFIFLPPLMTVDLQIIAICTKLLSFKL